jgi:hypothetical protein
LFRFIHLHPQIINSSKLSRVKERGLLLTTVK